MVNADATTKAQSERSERIRHFVVKSVLLEIVGKKILLLLPEIEWV